MQSLITQECHMMLWPFGHALLVAVGFQTLKLLCICVICL